MSPTVLRLYSADGLHELACPADACIEIGSVPECEIMLEGATILPRHCVLRRMGETRFRIQRVTPEARFTVNGVYGPDLEAETPFRFGIGAEEITFSLVVDSEEVDEEANAVVQQEDVPAHEDQSGARVNRRDYLLQPTTLRPRAGERVGEVVLDNDVGARGLPHSKIEMVPLSEAKPEALKAGAEESSSKLVFAGLLVCGLMVGGIFYWQQFLDGMPPSSASAAVATSRKLEARELSSEELIEVAADLRQAGMSMLATHVLMPQAEEGNIKAMHELGLAFLQSGEFAGEAIFLLRGAAEGGSREALADLVEAVENPLNMDRYKAEAFQHLDFAVKLGETNAWMPLGERFEQGHGVGKDLELALAAYEMARAAGERRAAPKLAARQEALECVAGFVRSWNEVSVATLLDHVSSRPQRYFTQEKPAMEALLRAEEQMRALWPLRRISVIDGAKAKLSSFEHIEVTQPFQFELQRGGRIARGTGLFTCEVEREEGGWRVVSARDEIAIKVLLPAGDQFTSAESLRDLKPAFSVAEQVEETRLEILEKMRGLEETQDFKPALTLILNAAMTFPQEEFWRPFADKLSDRMSREFFAQGRWLDAALSAPVHQLAELGSVSAMLLEGHLLMAGYGYTRDEKRGVAMYEKAFEVGKRRDARFYYAEALFQGRGATQDFEKAGALVLSFMTRSKHPLEAYLAAHLLWRKAEADPALWQQVYDTLSRVAEKHPPAKHLAGMVLLNHGNTTRERKTGFAALKAAAEAGVPEAMKNLSKCYLDGSGCEKDAHQAMLWKQKAAVTEPPRRRHYTEFVEQE
ncbi:MAG: hypothetical protein JNM65_07805 [Verrucomicrobiaceae bacterium]|nr:hypothetical protein [Verrucomicrobiaceae bacterium]